MYRAWEEKVKKYSETIKTIANDLETKMTEIKNESDIRKLHKEWLDFITKHDARITKSHWDLIIFWDKKVSQIFQFY